MAPNPGNTGNKKANALQKINPLMWRQARTVKKAVQSVDELVSNMIEGATFLEETKPSPSIALFNRTDFTTGKLLGEGSFSQVYEVTSIQFSDSHHQSKTDSSNPEDVARRELIQTVQDDRYMDCVTRGILWATGNLSDDGTPTKSLLK